MGQLSGIYDSAFVQPIARIKEHLAIWTQSKWQYFLIDYEEPLPPGPATTIDMCVVAAVANIAANGTIIKRIVPALQLTDNEFVHLRWFPIDNVVGRLWELGGQQHLTLSNLHATVSLMTREWDPQLVTTTFWVMGQRRDFNLEVLNNMPWIVSAARFTFFGYRYLLTQKETKDFPPDVKNGLDKGDPTTVRNHIGVVTFVPAEGRQA